MTRTGFTRSKTSKISFVVSPSSRSDIEQALLIIGVHPRAGRVQRSRCRLRSSSHGKRRSAVTPARIGERDVGVPLPVAVALHQETKCDDGLTAPGLPSNRKTLPRVESPTSIVSRPSTPVPAVAGGLSSTSISHSSPLAVREQERLRRLPPIDHQSWGRSRITCRTVELSVTPACPQQPKENKAAPETRLAAHAQESPQYPPPPSIM